MKKFLSLFFVVAIFITALISCSKSNPTDSPAATATQPPPASTSTPTVTFTPTATNTAGILIDNFEDNNLVSNISCSDCTNTLELTWNAGGAVTLSGLVAAGGTPLNGAYYYSVTGTTKKDAGTAVSVIVKTMKTNATSTGTDITALGTVGFDYKLNAADAITLRFYLYNDSYGDGIYYDIALVNDNTWHSVSTPISGFTGSLSNVKPSVSRLFYQIRTVSGSAPTQDVYFEFNVDNIEIRP